MKKYVVRHTVAYGNGTSTGIFLVQNPQIIQGALKCELIGSFDASNTYDPGKKPMFTECEHAEMILLGSIVCTEINYEPYLKNVKSETRDSVKNFFTATE